MAIHPDIRDQAYQFFVEEAPELLQVLESGLLTLTQEHSITTIHNLMRAAHSIKGGASSVGLDAIATLAHRFENIFRVLYGDTVAIDTDLESQLLQAYDCLRLPLMEQIRNGALDSEAALAIADSIFTQIEERCGEALYRAESYIPSSSELGVDMVSSIFEVDVAQGLEHLATVVANPQNYEVVGEVRAQIEVFAGFSELFNLPEFGTIAETVQHALNHHPERALEIAQMALTDFGRSREAILTGDRHLTIAPSASLLQLAEAPTPTPSSFAPSAPEVANGTAPAADPLEEAIPLLEDIFSNPIASFDRVQPAVNSEFLPAADPGSTFSTQPETTSVEIPENLEAALQSIEQIFDTLPSLQKSVPTPTESVNAPPLQAGALIPSDHHLSELSQSSQTADLASNPLSKLTSIQPREMPAAANLTVRVDSDRLERMNNVVGELAINRDGLSLQSEQLQGALRDLLNRFARFQERVGNLREFSDQMLVAPERYTYSNGTASTSNPSAMPRIAASTFPSAYNSTALIPSAAEFDSLEMDNYGSLHAELQEILEDMVQLEETVDDITLFSKQSNQMLEQQRRMLSQLGEEVRWARMLPLSEILNRFPRVLRDLSTTYRKPVSLKLADTGVLVEKAILEKLYDPLLHLLRNAFDHGIEPSDFRRQRGKPEQGEIEIRAYHKGNQTIIEVKDDGQGLNLERIGNRAHELGWISTEQLAEISPVELSEFIFEPGFSTASQVSELSGRGVGLDVVRSQLRSIKGTVSVQFTPGQGTVFTLALPLTLTIAKLIVCVVGSSPLALPTNSIEEILTPQAENLRQSGSQRFLFWREQIIPVYRLANLINYACPLPEASPSKLLTTIPAPKDWSLPMLILRWERQLFALEVDRLVTEQELVIKPFSTTITPPSYVYGCTILGDGSLIPVIDGNALISLEQNQGMAAIVPAQKAVPTLHESDDPTHQPPVAISPAQAATVLVVDDAATLRRTLALSLKRAGFRVLQARDGREAIDQLEQSASIQLVICDIEMPNMNGFEFLSYRRQDAQLAKIPVVMLTSRSNEKHRWLATQLGATAYLTKPYLEQELLAVLRNSINPVDSRP